jgi:hypothetical protein
MLVKLTACEPELALACSKCGAAGHASCGCDAPYVRVQAAISDDSNRHLSNRALAAKVGVSDMTIGRARKSSGATRVAPDKVTGKDGKSYPRKPKRRKAPRRATVENSVDPLFLKISEVAAIMDKRSAESVIAETKAQFDSGVGLDRAYTERLAFVRDWLNSVIQGSEVFIVTCSINTEED